MKSRCNLKYTVLLAAALAFPSTIGIAQETSLDRPSSTPLHSKGVFPQMSAVAEQKNISEAGIGALIPWADRLWAVSYVAHIRGGGTGLYEIDPSMHMRKHAESVVGTYANRMLHIPSGQAIIGPHVIDADGNVRTIDSLKGHRLTATVQHLTDPENKVYFLGMEGSFWEVDIRTLVSKKLYNLVETLELPEGTRPHFKGAYTANGRVVVANNTYHEPEHLGTRHGGRLAEWNGETWTILDRNPYVEVAGKNETGKRAVLLS